MFLDLVFLLSWSLFTGMFLAFMSMFASHKEKMNSNRLKESELKNKMSELETEKQKSQEKLLEEENRKYDRIIYELENDKNKMYLERLIQFFI